MFEKLKSFLYRILIIMLTFIGAKSCVSDYMNGGDKEKIAQYEQMIEENSFIYADLAEQYTKTTIAKTIESYNFDYNFTLNNDSYSGKISLNELPNSPKLKLYYLSSNPNIVEHNPFESIKDEKEKGTLTDLLGGIVLGIIFLISSFSFVKLIIDKTKKVNTKISTKKNKSEKNYNNRKAKKLIVEEISDEEKRRLAEEKERIRKEKEDPTRFMPK